MCKQIKLSLRMKAAVV